MDDLISRKWLMECIDEGWIKFDTEKDTNRYIHLVRDIAPSAQPERKTDGDLISRQAAIDAINKALDRETVVSRWVRKVAVDAVKVLPSAQPSATDTNVGGNLIDRQAAIDRIVAIKPTNPAKSEYTHGIDTGLAMAMVAFKEQPSAQPEGQWIPVTPETMPKAGEIVLVTLPEHVGEDGEKYYSGVISAYYIDLGDGWWFRSDGVKCGELVGCGATPIAWMPKPKPWKGAMRHESDD